jgi:hypothetical protein
VAFRLRLLRRLYGELHVRPSALPMPLDGFRSPVRSDRARSSGSCRHRQPETCRAKESATTSEQSRGRHNRRYLLNATAPTGAVCVEALHHPPRWTPRRLTAPGRPLTGTKRPGGLGPRIFPTRRWNSGGYNPCRGRDDTGLEIIGCSSRPTPEVRDGFQSSAGKRLLRL